MTELPKTRRRNLARLVDEHGLSEVARRVNKPASQISDMLVGRKSFGEKIARAIEQAWGSELPPLWLDEDADPKVGSGQPRRHELPKEKGNVFTWTSPDDLPDDPNRVWIDRYDYRFSAGDGTVQWEVRQKHALPFDGGFFEKIGSRPQDCKLCIVRGDSMEPYLFNRDMMMVDSAKTIIRDGRVYAVIFEDEALVKQVFKQVGGSLVLHSYNSPKYPDKEIPADKLEYLKIAGEVIYRSGTGPAGGN